MEEKRQNCTLNLKIMACLELVLLISVLELHTDKLQNETHPISFIH